MAVNLSTVEERVCTLLDDCCKSLKQEHSELPEVQCRIAGGWVRDKLLGLKSDDIDVALSSMMGKAFGDQLKEYCEKHAIDVGTVSVVPSNRELSKHLDTAKLRVLKLELDLVNLRAEDYAEDSRIPTARFGTPLQDALRRDLTINALFYNVHSRAVEDFTGKGLSDLAAGICRTPLPPMQTFLDDPLRIPRAIRFASRFGFSLTEEMKEAMKLPEIQAALVSKVSRERVGIEIEKMLKGPNPLMALTLIHDMKLYSTLFHLTPRSGASLSGQPLSETTSVEAASILHHLLVDEGGPSLPILERAREDANVRKRLYLASALTPYGRLTYTSPEKKKSAPAVEGVIREGLKLGNQDITATVALFQAAPLLSNPALSRFASPLRVSIGVMLRNPAVHNPITGAHWADSTTFSLVQDLLPFWDAKAGSLNDKAKDVMRVYEDFIKCVEELGLPHALEEKPRLDGKEIAAALNIKPGPAMATVISAVVEWQLEYPDGSKDDCRKWLQAAVKDGTITLDAEPAKMSRDPDGQNVPKRARKR